MRKIYTTIITLFAACSVQPMAAQEFTADGISYKVIDAAARTCEVAASDIRYSGDIVIPAEVTYGGTTYSVTAIGTRAFQYSYYMTSITIPESVTSVGGWAFESCEGLKTVDLPDAVTSINDGTFFGCTSLTSVDIPEGVTSVGEWAFSDCNVLSAIALPEAVSHINTGAFYNCTALTTFNIPQKVSAIEVMTFYGCSALTSITIHAGITSIDDFAFDGCTELGSFVVEEDNPNYFASGGFLFEKGTSEVVSIAYGMTSLIIPEGWTEIKDKMFYGLPHLETVHIPQTVTSIGWMAFSNCFSLKAFTVDADNEYFSTQSGLLLSKDKTRLLIAPAGLETITVPNTISNIDYASFRGNSKLKKVTLNSELLYIYDEAFQDCSSLTGINIPKNVEGVGWRAFKGCTSLQEITVHEDNLYLSSKNNLLLSKDGKIVCAVPYGVTEIVIPEGVTYIGEYVFEEHNLLKKVVFPETLEEIGEAAFYRCENLIKVHLPKNLKTIKNSCFQSCFSLESVTIPAGVTEIGDWAFAECSRLKEVYSFIEKPFPVDAFGIALASGVNILFDLTIYVPQGTKEAYENTSGWSTYRWDHRTNIVEFDVTGIDGPKIEIAAPVEIGRYTLDGRRISSPQRGVNIVRYSDGSVRKVMVR